MTGRAPRSSLSVLTPRIGTMRRTNPHQYVDTPPEATRAFLAAEGARLRDITADARGARIWECAAGGGAIARELARAGFDVTCSDIRRGRVEGEGGVDFLATREARAPAIVTNPPYKDLPWRFVAHALALGLRYIALLLPCGWPQAAAANIELCHRLPPARIWPLGFRLDFTGAGKALPTFHSWFVWEFGRVGPTEFMPPLIREDAA